jgi:hypothetical protein
VKIDLLSSGKPIGTASVDDLARPAVVWVIANVFDEQVGVGANFPLYDKRRFGDRIALRLVQKPELVNMPLRPQPPPTSRDQGNWT